MKVRTLLSVAAIVSTIGLPSMAFAQEHMISGKAVPADEVAAVQAKCDELHKAPAPAAMAPAAPEAKPAAGAAAAPAAGWTADGKIDLTKLTAAMCTEAGFAAK